MDFDEFASYMGGRIATPRAAAQARSAQSPRPSLTAMPRGRPASATATGLLVQPAARGAVVADPRIAVLVRQMRQEIARLQQENERLHVALSQAQEAAKAAWRGRGQAVEVEVEGEEASEAEAEAEDVSEGEVAQLDENPWGPDEGA